MEWFLAVLIPVSSCHMHQLYPWPWLTEVTLCLVSKCLYHEKIHLSERWLLELVPVTWEVSLEGATFPKAHKNFLKAHKNCREHWVNKKASALLPESYCIKIFAGSDWIFFVNLKDFFPCSNYLNCIQTYLKTTKQKDYHVRVHKHTWNRTVGEIFDPLNTIMYIYH